ncbi:hypothetical protein TNCT_29151 [Trichonephila clavata]|uniref:Uncharacterized protein n=1 Tax=Trichonephila clavata TaxID=2740835 RepID=A0A8X6LTA1_TRICU|nr:hypothetical protein TNCT_29151 [Trichonephila clavata]
MSRAQNLTRHFFKALGQKKDIERYLQGLITAKYEWLKCGNSLRERKNIIDGYKWTCSLKVVESSCNVCKSKIKIRKLLSELQLGDDQLLHLLRKIFIEDIAQAVCLHIHLTAPIYSDFSKIFTMNRKVKPQDLQEVKEMDNWNHQKCVHPVIKDQSNAKRLIRRNIGRS